ncbi:TrlF family AAA-like ATPase [Acinetobacter lwoffii]|uniref:TrlF family AAA-like ATPase n=1 Tax=Acinetobacter lwoffii TaxID=28090 RepID=UPI001FF415E2|nr:hypothetical protein [Acinetobacter lwoffii]MCJ8512304.1 hypothetical protein [Acinetobacter lwoffii]MCO8070411.1 hypothetical protein [Acinetobacter lwoffii]
MSRGSEWGRWDLHVHTKGTAKSDKFGNISFEDYCIQLFNKAVECNIKAIGITDYFSIENYKKVKDFQDQIHTRTDFDKIKKERICEILLIPNIELRIIPSTDKGSAINMHFLLNPEIIEDFENQYCDALTFTVTEEEQYKLTPYDLKRLGRKGVIEYISDESAYRNGISSFVLNSSDIIKAFKKYPNFRKNCLVAVANSNKDGASAFQGHEKFLNSQQDGATLKVLRESLYKVSDIIFSSTLTDKPFFLGKNTADQSIFLDNYGTYKPCIHGSDAHDLDTLFEPTDQKYCWIKAEPTFEGLKQIIHEPESRVHIGQHCPEIKNSYEVIDYIELNNTNVANEKIYFNGNLTSIIGGRSSGKSTLLQCLANKLKPTALNSLEQSQHIDELCSNFRIIWQDGKEDYSRPIEYFYQGHMYSKSKDQGIEDIVKDLIQQKDNKLFSKFKEQSDFLRHEISGKVSTYFSILSSLTDYQSQLTQKGNKDDIQNQVNELSIQIQNNDIGNITQEEMASFNTSNETLTILNKNLEGLITFKELLEDKHSSDFYQLLNPFELSLNYVLVKSHFESFASEIEKFTATQFEQFKKLSQKTISDQILKVEQEILSIKSTNIFQKVEVYLRSSDAIKPLLERLNIEKAKIQEIDDILEKIAELKKSLESLTTEFQRTIWLSMSNVASELIQAISSITISQDLQIIATNIFDKFKFNEFIKKTINQQPEKAKLFAEMQVTSQIELLDKYHEIVESLEEGEVRFRGGTTLETFTKEFFDNSWFKIKFDVIYDDDNYNEMSQGKKAFVVLKMTLDCSESKCPIIIDQPEDDLDNRAIYSELVAFLKQKKKERQIILVTHNANVVVNADSELIIVANQHGTHSPNMNKHKFQYKFGSIESLDFDPTCTSTLNQKTIKSHICEILEGGDRAFKLREQKYNLAS